MTLFFPCYEIDDKINLAVENLNTTDEINERTK